MLTSTEPKSSDRLWQGSARPASKMMSSNQNKSNVGSTKSKASIITAFLRLPPEIRANIYKHYCEMAEIKLRVTIWNDRPARQRASGHLAVWEKEAHPSALMQLCRLVRSEFADFALSRLPLVFWVDNSLSANNLKVSVPWVRKLVPELLAARVRHVALVNAEDAVMMQFASLFAEMSDWFPSLKTIAMRSTPDIIETVLMLQGWAMIGSVSTPEKKNPPVDGLYLGQSQDEEEHKSYVVSQSRRYQLSKSAEAAYGTMVANYLCFQGRWNIVRHSLIMLVLPLIRYSL